MLFLSYTHLGNVGNACCAEGEEEGPKLMPRHCFSYLPDLAMMTLSASFSIPHLVTDLLPSCCLIYILYTL
jgi:hypothetical protein